MIKLETRLGLTMNKYPLSVQRREENQGGEGQKIKFVNPNTDNYENNIRSCAARRLPMAKADLHLGSTAVVCGSGPSLKDPEVLKRIKQEQDNGAIVYACKAAIRFLDDHGIKVDYGVSMDPGAHIADPRKIAKVKGVTHIIASTSDPDVFEYLLGSDYGDPSTVWVFHSATGFQRVIEWDSDEWDELSNNEKKDYVTMEEKDDAGVMRSYHVLTEVNLYANLFPDGAVMGGGFNVVNRTVTLANYMGAAKIVLAGADSGWRDGVEMYCDGPEHRPGVNMTDKGVVDGKNWNTRPDMLASAVALAKLAKEAGEDKFDILGDTLPASLVNKPVEFLNQVASF